MKLFNMVKQHLLAIDTTSVEVESESQLNYSPSKDKIMNQNSSITPRTEASLTPVSTPGTGDYDNDDNDTSYPPTRGHSDIRSPGMAKTPSMDKERQNNNNKMNTHQPTSSSSPSPSAPQINTIDEQDDVDNNAPIPDFMTQTDKYGNASTPRTPNGAIKIPTTVQKTDTDETEDLNANEQEDEDACDTLLESLRLMCCCLLPDSNNNNSNNHPHHQLKSQPNTKENGNRISSSSPKNISKMQIAKHRLMNGHGSIYGHLDDAAFFHEATQIKLLPEIIPADHGKKCLVLDLDETLVHSSFRAVKGADFVIPVQIEDVVHYVYVAKRPGVDEFLIEMAKHYEIILYTASLNKYADPLLDLLDTHRTIRTRLFRESCVYFEGNYVKDLSLLDRDLSKTIIIDNSPASYIFHPENAIDCSSFIDDPKDRELNQISDFLKGVKDVKDVKSVMGMWREWPHIPRLELETNVNSHRQNGHGMNTFESREDRHVQLQ